MTGSSVVKWGKTLLIAQLSVVFLLLSVFTLGLHTLSLSKKFNQVPPADTIVVQGQHGQDAIVDYDKLKLFVKQEVAKIPPSQNGKDGTSIPGTNGQNGKTNYELWLEQGNTGTLDDFLNSQRGDVGQPGKPVELRTNPDTGNIEWRYEGQRLWTLLLDVCILTDSCND